MSFDLFGNTRREDVRVGYISTDRGFVSDISIYDANKYAELNPAAQFVVSNRDKVAYININELNRKSKEDISFLSYIKNHSRFFILIAYCFCLNIL